MSGDWQERQGQAREDQMLVFGEEVGLPSGETVQGVYDPLGDPAPDQGPVQSLPGRPSAQPNPVLRLSAADAEGLTLGSAPIIVRNLAHKVTRPLTPDGTGWVVLELRILPAVVDSLEGMP